MKTPSKEYAHKVIAFYDYIGRPLTVFELWTALPRAKRPETLHNLSHIVKELKDEQAVYEQEGILAVSRKEKGRAREERMLRDKMLEEKWKKILRLRWAFNLIPYLNFACVSGSVSLGNVNKDSDVDIVIGCKKGRIFTVRLAVILLFGIMGKRRGAKDKKRESRDKFCFNHFVTEEAYELSPPRTFYWEEIYTRMVPVYGNEKDIEKFFRANKWCGGEAVMLDKRWKKRDKTLASIIEWICWKEMGDIIEKIAKKIQLVRINAHQAPQRGERIRISDEELEFHGREEEFQKILKKLPVPTDL
ncbi:hypothetical protein A3A21_02865 [Candidatus Jorgensenbacteria bacterium RIFCSPLOWO2_01_FULL_45_25b]|uniref:Polymerase nucleotidyl transferase domain-containing protein n=1 Tax=Candidatus Jorgensenbacteria bacterium RIFCSPLOWO2_01_FULL_45_25b TaxID=1798471 RepID=A0A1F6BZ77_9BACT|nr:MAG: hypothetical protein A3A21_02865 [Candidatus Jorgensenbacteria bacterium RIFCSPLOWO2_01_FULL_45_25b]